MTTIIMVQTPDDVIIGYDSLASVNDGGVWHLKNSKVVVNNGIILGVAGTLRILNQLTHMAMPDYTEDRDAEEWIVTEFIPAVRATLAAADIDDDEGRYNAGMLMVVDGQVFELDGYMSVTQNIDDKYAIGTGRDAALGALDAGATVMHALMVAKYRDLYTGGDLTVRCATDMLFEERTKNG